MIVATVDTDVSYDMTEAAIDVDKMVAELERLKREDGVTHIVVMSGNHRGPKYLSLMDPEVE